MSEMPRSSSDEQIASLDYTLKSLEAFQRWQSRAMWIGYSVAALTFAVTLYALSQVTDDGSLGMVLSLFAAVGALAITIGVVLPMLPSPLLRCPYCAGQVPLIAKHKPFTRVAPTERCPHCDRALAG